MTAIQIITQPLAIYLDRKISCSSKKVTNNGVQCRIKDGRKRRRGRGRIYKDQTGGGDDGEGVGGLGSRVGDIIIVA
jgi:hypothetical protein